MNAVPSTAPQNTVTWNNSLVCLVYLHYKSPWFQLCKQLSFSCTGQSKKKHLSKLQSLNYLALLNACHNHKALQVFAMGTQIKQGHSQTKPEPITEWPKNTFNHLHHCNSFTHAKSRDMLILHFPSPWIIFSLHDKSRCWMGPHFTCKQRTQVQKSSSKWRLRSSSSAGTEYPVTSELQLCKNYRHVHILDTISITV